MTNFVKPGTTIKYTHGSAVTAGDVILIGEKIVVAKSDALANVENDYAAQGAFDFPKTAATVYAQGKKVFWDVADQEATEDDDVGVNRLIGYTQVAALSADTTVQCYLVNNVL